MAIQSDGVYRDILTSTYSKFNNYQTSTNLYTYQQSTNLQLAKQPSQSPIIFQKNILIHTQQSIPYPSLPSQLQILQITQRFQKVKELLIKHSQRESFLHQKIYAFKEMTLDWSQLSSDFTNKINITEDLKHLVNTVQGSVSQQMQQLLQTKFQQYYLQRHYGGLKCQNYDLNIQQKGQKSFQSIHLHSHSNKSNIPHEQPSQSFSYFNLREQKENISSIGGYVSLINQSKLTYTQQFCQTNQDNNCLVIQIPKIIEIEIPLIIYRIKERIITYDESDIEAPYKDIDQIIDKYSKPYEDLYTESDKELHFAEEVKDEFENHLEIFDSIAEHHNTEYSFNSQIGSIMVDSNVNRQIKETEVELTYSRLPEDILMMDSFARIGSLITNKQTEKDEHDNNYAVKITQKCINPQKLQEYYGKCRNLTHQNEELNQLIKYLKEQLYKSENKRCQIESLNIHLNKKLKEQIESRQSLQQKCNKMNPSAFTDKINLLSNQNTSLYDQIQRLMTEIRYKNHQLQVTRAQLQQTKIISLKTEEQLTRTQNQLAFFTKQLQQCEQQLYHINSSQQQVIKIASKTETSLKEQIEKLEEEKTEITIKLQYYQTRVENQGFNLQYQQAKQIQAIIEQRQHIHQIQLNQLQQKQEQMINLHRAQIDELKQQIKILTQSKQTKSQITCTTLKQHPINSNYLTQIESLIKQYDRELSIKDEEIITLKQAITRKNRVEDHDLLMNKAIGFIVKITTQLEKERQQRMAITERLIQIDRLVNKQNISEDKDDQSLIQSFAFRLQTILKQNVTLKQKISQLQSQSQQQPQLNNTKQIDKLRKINIKLKRYTLQMQQELISISGMKNCQSHHKLLNNIMEQRNYYMQLLTN